MSVSLAVSEFGRSAGRLSSSTAGSNSMGGRSGLTCGCDFPCTDIDAGYTTLPTNRAKRNVRVALSKDSHVASVCYMHKHFDLVVNTRVGVVR